MQKLLSFSFLFTIAMFLVGCGNSETDSAENNEEESQLITIVSGGTGGTFYTLGGGLAEIYSDLENVTVNSQSTDGSEVNINLVNDDKAQLGFANSSLVYYGATGTEMFDEVTNNVSGIGALYPMHYHLVVSSNSDIQSVSDLEGKDVAVGPQGSGTEANVRQLLEGWELTYDDFNPSYISFDNASDQLTNNAIDAAFVGAGAPTSSVTELISGGDARLVPLEHEVINELIEGDYPFFETGVIPADTYPNQEEDIETALIGASLIVNSDLNEDTVYDLTKNLFENLDRLESTHSVAEEINLENSAQMNVELHPGAKRYYEEEGIEISEENR